jgi:predicted amidohydrolase
MRIAAIQLSSTADRAENLEAAGSLMRDAVEQGARLLVLPEHFSFLTGPGGYAANAEDPESGPTLRFLREFAAANHVAIVGGSIPLRAGADHVTNSCLAVDQEGAVLARYDKMHLFDVDLDIAHQLRESDEVVAGTDIVTVTVQDLRVGLSICYDLRFPELYRRLMGQGAKLMTVPSNFTVPTGRVHWKILLRARAIENQCYVVAPAQCGTHADAPASYGHSMIVDPWGKIVAEAEVEPVVLVAELDMNHLKDIRRRLPCLTHRRLD